MYQLTWFYCTQALPLSLFPVYCMSSQRTQELLSLSLISPPTYDHVFVKDLMVIYLVFDNESMASVSCHDEWDCKYNNKRGIMRILSINKAFRVHFQNLFWIHKTFDWISLKLLIISKSVGSNKFVLKWFSLFLCVSHYNHMTNGNHSADAMQFFTIHKFRLTHVCEDRLGIKILLTWNWKSKKMIFFISRITKKINCSEWERHLFSNWNGTCFI